MLIKFHSKYMLCHFNELSFRMLHKVKWFVDAVCVFEQHY